MVLLSSRLYPDRRRDTLGTTSFFPCSWPLFKSFPIDKYSTKWPLPPPPLSLRNRPRLPRRVWGAGKSSCSSRILLRFKCTDDYQWLLIVLPHVIHAGHSWSYHFTVPSATQIIDPPLSTRSDLLGRKWSYLREPVTGFGQLTADRVYHDLRPGEHV